MKRIESLLAWLALAGAAVTGGLALAVLGFLAATRLTGAPEAGAAAAPVAEAAAEEVAAEPAAPAAAAETAQMAALDPEAGKAVFRQCQACHTAEKGGPDRVGPNLWGIVDAPAAAHEGFKYSAAMAGRAGTAWTPAELDTYLTDPRKVAPGTTMAFAGVKRDADRRNLIAFLAAQSDAPRAPEALGFAAPAAAGAAGAAEEPADIPAVAYADPPPRSAAEQAEIAARVAALEAELDGMDYQTARFHPLHFPPAIETASNEECLACHREVLEDRPREASPAGVPAAETLAWYQTLDTYAGDQQSFHFRHLQSDFAQRVMRLDCNFCHKGNDPREESPDLIPVRAAFGAPAAPEFTLRKMVNPETTCLRCHGTFPNEIMGLEPWHIAREDLEYEEMPNGCLSCHEELYRTSRHLVSYLKAASIEEAAREGSSDTCYGCHGGRAWYRISYPYPRHPWPGMDPETPDWAADRPTESEAGYRLAPAAAE